MDRNAPISIAAAVLVSVIGVFALMTQPLVVGVLVDKLDFTLQQATLVIVAEVAGGALASIAAIFWIGRINWRTAVAGAVVVVIVGNAISVFQTDATVLTVLRFLTGFFGQGTAFALGLAMIGGTKQVDRNFAFVIAAQVGFGVLAFISLRPIVDAVGGIGGIYVPLAVLAAVTLLLLKHMPEAAAAREGFAAGEAGASRALPIFGLIVMVIWCSGLGAVWNFMERIGVAGGLESASALQALALSSFVAILGALAASAMAGKVGRILPVSVALLMQIVMIWLLQGQMAWAEFAIKASIFQIFWNMTGPFIMGAIASSDTSGKLSVLIPASQTSGFFIGPTIAGAFMASDSLAPATFVGMACCAIALVIFVPLAMRLKAAGR